MTPEALAEKIKTALVNAMPEAKPDDHFDMQVLVWRVLTYDVDLVKVVREAMAEHDKGEDKMTSMTFGEFATINRVRCQHPDGFDQQNLNDWSLNDWMVALAGEVGEACNVAKKLKRSEGVVNINRETNDELRDQLIKELGDVGVYLDLVCQAYGFTMEEAMTAAFNKTSRKIGYPVEIKS